MAERKRAQRKVSFLPAGKEVWGGLTTAVNAFVLNHFYRVTTRYLYSWIRHSDPNTVHSNTVPFCTSNSPLIF